QVCRDDILWRTRRCGGRRRDRAARADDRSESAPGIVFCRSSRPEHHRHEAARGSARSRSDGVTMKCPYCAHLGDKVVDSRESKEGEVIRRRRECLGCGKRFTSYERIDEIPYMVVKKNGSRERFDRQKLIAGLL